MQSNPEPAPTARRGLALGSYPLLLIAGCLIGLAILASGWDQAFSSWARTWDSPVRGPVDELVGVVRVFGKGEVAIVLGLALGALGWRRQAVQILVALLLVAMVVSLVKIGVMRERPNHSYGYAFPSGDAATIAAMIGPLIARNWRLAPPLVALMLGVAYARIHQGYHYPTDVLAGCAAGLLAASIAPALVARFQARFQKRSPRLPPARAWLATAIAFTVVTVAVQTFARGHQPNAGGDLYTFLTVLGPALALLIAARWWSVAARANVGRPLALPGWLGGRVAPLLIGLATLLALVWLSTRSSLWDRDEPRFARASVEMAQSGDYVVPTYNGQERLHKPAGIYWLMSTSLRTFGETELAARLPAVLAALAIAWLTWWIGRRLASPQVGAWAAAIVVTTPLLVVCGSAATTDAVLVASISAAMALIARRLTMEHGPSRWDTVIATIGCALAMGYALLVKGPLGLAVPALAVGGIWILLRGQSPFRTRSWDWFLVAIVIAAVLFLCWGIPANRQTDGRYLEIGVGKHVINRSVTAMESHGGGFWKSLPYYVPVVIATFFPWIALLPGALSALIAGRLGLQPRAFLLAWMAPTFVVMSCVATKLPHYILPIFPALAVAVALQLDAARAGRLAERDWRWLRVGAWLMSAMAAVLVLVLLAAPWLRLIPLDDLPPKLAKGLATVPPLPYLLGPLLAIALVMVVIAVMSGRAIVRRRLEHAGTVMAFGMAMFVFAAGMRAMPLFEELKPSKPLALAIRAATPATVPVSVVDYDEASLHFYLGRGPITAIAQGEATVAWAMSPGPGVLVLTRGALAALGTLDGVTLSDTGAGQAWRITDRAAGSRTLRLVGAREGLNVANGKWCDLVAVAKD